MKKENIINRISEAQKPHYGVFITGINKVELLNDSIPKKWFQGNHFITESLGNSVCSSDLKAIRQFRMHSRIPNNAIQIALGHETIQRIIKAPNNSKISPGQIVLISPGLTNQPINPETFSEDKSDGVLASLGYSFRYAAGMRKFNGIPEIANEIISSQGLGKLFIPINNAVPVSLATLAHAEPFACCYGALQQIITRNQDNNEIRTGLPKNARIVMLSGTGRMAMITLAILARGPLPAHITITGSREKLDLLHQTSIFSELQLKGVKINLVDRMNKLMIGTLLKVKKFDVAITFYPSQEIYNLAEKLVRVGGNINNFAGAIDPELYLPMTILKVKNPSVSSVSRMLHQKPSGNKKLLFGLSANSRIALRGFENNTQLARVLLNSIPPKAKVNFDNINLLKEFPKLELFDEPFYTDVFIGSTGEPAANHYQEIEQQLDRNAAVSFIEGDTKIKIKSRHIHYFSRHQIYGDNVPYFITNTSEPNSLHLEIQANECINFDWMVQRVAGLKASISLLTDIEKHSPFGSHFVLPQIDDLPFVEINEKDFQNKAIIEHKHGRIKSAKALRNAAKLLKKTNNQWSREVEECLYDGYNITYPLK